MSLTGCSRDRDVGRSVPIASAFGAYVGDEIVIVPSYHWQATEVGGWRFHARGELLVHVAEGAQLPPDGIEIVLRAASSSQGYVPRVTWRGEELDPEGFETRGGALTDAALAQIAGPSPRPRFLFVNYFDPHALFQAPEPFRRQFGVEEAAVPLRDREVWGALVDGDGSVLSAAIRGEGGFGPEVEEYLLRAYRAELAWMDEQLGRLFEGLRQAEQWEKSLIVVVADHGELLGERGLFTHAHRLDPELIEIPLLIKWPGQTTGYRIQSPVSQVDLFPTLLRAAGVAVPSDQRGVLLYPDREPSVAEDRPLVFEEHESAPHPLFAEMKVARDLVGVQIGDLRILGRDDVRTCQRITEGVWQEIDCPSGVWELDELMAVVEEAPRLPADAVARSASEEAALRALGYL